MPQVHVRESLSAYIDGEVAAAERARIGAHLESCEECRQYLDELRRTVAFIQSSEPVRAPEGFRAQVRSKLEEGTSRSGVAMRWPQLRWSWRTAGAVAAVLLIGMFSLNLLRDRFPSLTSDLRERAAKTGTAPSSTPSLDVNRYGTQNAAQPEAPQRVGGGPTIPDFRRVIRNGQLWLEVEKFDETSRRLVIIAEGAGGFVADSSYTQSAGTPEGVFTLRVPAARFASVVNEVEGIGRVLQRHVSGQDVTEEYVDLQARVRNLERHEQRLLTFMDRATKVSDLLAIEQELARVRGEIEQLTGRMRYLDNRADLATVEVSVREKAKKASGLFWDFGGSLDRIQKAFLATIRQLLGALEQVAVIVSALFPVALLGAGAWLLVRRLRFRES